MDGQMSIFDFIKTDQTKCGEWVTEHGERVFFDDIQENQYYIADYSTCQHQWFKVIFVKWKTDESIGYVDSEKGVAKPDSWRWGNNYSCLTRRMYVDGEERHVEALGYANKSGWFYKLP